MVSLNGVRGGSFNQLLNVIKGLSRRSGSNQSGQQNGKILSNLMELVPSISFLMKEHPQHIPVLLYHLTSVTSKIKVPVGRQCVTGFNHKYNNLNNNSCKICNGVCKEVYSNFLDRIEENLPSFGPKGLSNIINAYSYCKNLKISKILNEIQLRLCYFIYCGSKRINNEAEDSVYNNIDSVLYKYCDSISKFPVSSIQEGDYLIYFIKHILNNEDNLEVLVNKSKYYIPVNLMDITTTLSSIDSINYTKDLIKNIKNQTSRGFITEYSNGSSDVFFESESRELEGFKDLLLDLSFGFLFNNSFRSNVSKNLNRYVNLDRNQDSNLVSCLHSGLDLNLNIDLVLDFESRFKFINLYEIDTVCRLINIFKQFRYENDLLSSMIVNILNSSLEDLDFVNLVSLLDSLNFYRSRVHTVDFNSLISRIDTLTSRVDLYSLKSLSTSIYILSNMKDIVSLENYNRFLKISKQGLERYVSKWKHLLKNQICLRAITTVLKSLGDRNTIDLVCRCVLDGFFTFENNYLYDYNVMLDILIKQYRKVNNINNNDLEVYHNTCNDNTNNNNIVDWSDNNVNNNNSSINNNDISNTNYKDLCKITSTICLIVSKCSPYYCKILSESFNNFKENKSDDEETEEKEEDSKEKGNINMKNKKKNKNCQLNGMEIRELCYFLNNISNFHQIEMVDNPYKKDYNDQISFLFGKVESYFIRNQPYLSEMDHSQISNFLSEFS